MKGILNLAIAGAFIFATSMSMAADSTTTSTTSTTSTNTTKTDMNTNWTCTTNASTATTDADKAADDQMAKNVTSATSAFAMAAQNCRDCTKITCEAQSSNQSQ